MILYLRRNWLLCLIFFTVLVVDVGVTAINLSSLASDDAFIHRRIALNYASTGWAYFNPGHRVMVTSSPLWTVVLAIALKVGQGFDLLPWIELFFVLAASAAGYLLCRQFQNDGNPASRMLAGVAFLWVNAIDLPVAIKQMETPLATVFMLVGVLGIRKKKEWGLATLLAAGFLRYECFLLFAVFAIWSLLKKRWTKLAVLSCVIVGIPCVSWIFWQYGTVIPNTVIAKKRLYILTHSVTFLQVFHSKGVASLFFLFFLLWLFYGMKKKYMLASEAVLLLAFGFLLSAAYIFGKSLIFSWYIPLILVPLAVGILVCTDSQSRRHVILGICASAVLVYPSANTSGHLLVGSFPGKRRWLPDYAEPARVHEYKRIGATLNSVCPAANLMTQEIGGLGWSFHGLILDGAGLASPEAIRYHPMRVPEERSSGLYGELPAGFVRDYHPDVIVSYDSIAESALPGARQAGYLDYSYPIFDREDRPYAHSLWGAKNMHVLVAPEGRCAAPELPGMISAALER
jgi:hypothetical protein